MKTNLNQLAIFGGKPVFDQQLHVGRPNIGDRQALMQRFNDVLDRRWLTNNGPCLLELEQKLAKYLGVKHVVAMCNATIALEILIRAADTSGEVLVPSYTFVATAHSLQWQQITPVFCDIDPATHSLDPQAVEKMITPRTTGIIGVHVWGKPCNIEALEEIARRRKLKLLFDAAHAFGCSYKGKMIGGFGLAEVLSFHATKFFNTLEGGAIVTNDDALADKTRLMRNFGFAGFDKVIYIGTNGKMNEISAAMGLTSLDALEGFLTVNKTNYEYYRSRVKDLPGISLIHYDPSEKNNYQYIVLEVDAERAGLSRDEIVEILWGENCLARKYFWPGCHNMEPYRSLFPHSHLLLPNTKTVADRVFLLPNGTAITPAMIDEMTGVIGFCVNNSKDVRQRLAARKREAGPGQP